MVCVIFVQYHVASMNIVYRNLACCNILIGENKTLKFMHFGLSREVEVTPYTHIDVHVVIDIKPHTPPHHLHTPNSVCTL